MTSLNVEYEAFKNYRSTFDDVILCNVGGLIGDVIPLNLTDRLYIIIECIHYKLLKSIRGSEGGLEGGREPELQEGGSKGAREGPSEEGGRGPSEEGGRAGGMEGTRALLGPLPPSFAPPLPPLPSPPSLPPTLPPLPPSLPPSLPLPSSSSSTFIFTTQPGLVKLQNNTLLNFCFSRIWQFFQPHPILKIFYPRFM